MQKIMHINIFKKEIHRFYDKAYLYYDISLLNFSHKINPFQYNE